MYREGACSGKVIWSPFIRFRVREGNRSPCCSLSPITSLPGFHVYRISASRAQEIIIPRPHRRGKHVTVEKIAKRCASPDTGLYHYENTNSSFPRKRETTTIALGSRFRGSDGWGAVEFRNFLTVEVNLTPSHLFQSCGYPGQNCLTLMTGVC